jgi:(p)ppGpp synthase/HD superfamily hydrolase
MVEIENIPVHQRIERADIARIREAWMFASGAHAAIGQLRKYTHDPYIVHPEEVALIVSTVPHVTEMIEAAYLHDVVEDTKVSIADIHVNFGPLVAHYVSGLTNVAKPEDGNRAKRFEINCHKLQAQCAEIQTIKVADLISNSATIFYHDPKFAVTYLKEKTTLLGLLTKADETLRRRAYLVVNAHITQIGEKS